jgi:5-methylcytosine-specific restriction endonuclease McrA
MLEEPPVADPVPIRSGPAERTLLLNSTYEPLQVISWQRAITMTWLEKVEVLRNYERVVRSVSRAISLPAVVRLRDYVRLRRVRLGFSRRSVFTRDSYRCQYCGEQCSPAEVTCDHVLPRSQGGATDWENVVAACTDCNRSKGGRTPAQAGMKLLRRPRQPDDLPLVFRIELGNRAAPEAWHEFLTWSRGKRDRMAG